MKISKLHVSNYRCFDHLHLDNLGKIVCLVGANGSGKSSILELIKRISNTSDRVFDFVRDAWGGNTSGQTLIIDLKLSESDKKIIRYGPENSSEKFEFVHIEPAPTSKERGAFRTNDVLIENTRDHFILYSPIRSFILEDSSDFAISGVSENPYRKHEILYPMDYGVRLLEARDFIVSHYQTRAKYLTMLLTKLLHMQREDLARTVMSGKAVSSEKYGELDIVHEIFNRFFNITGKTFLPPRTNEDGRTTYFFHVDWSSQPIPLSALSSGEQWLLFFFLEMRLNKWQNHVIMIDEIENHLHPKLALEFVKELKYAEDDNQYWITTHSPTIARYLSDCTLGLVLNEDQKTEIVEANSMDLLSSLTGREAVIPIGKTIVLLEGSMIPGQSLSVDETFFAELGELGINLEHVQFVSVGHVSSVMDMEQALTDFEKRIGVNWKIYAIRDRDAMSDDDRIDAMKSQKGRLWIWERSCLEGYFVEPTIVRDFLQGKRVTSIPEVAEIEEMILKQLDNHKVSIIERFERQLVYLKLPNRGSSTMEWLYEAGTLADSFQNEIIDFKRLVEDSLSTKKWRELLPFMDCKILIQKIYGRYLEKDVKKPKHFVDLIHGIMRDVIKIRLDESDDKLSVLEKFWPEVSLILKHLSDGTGFPI